MATHKFLENATSSMAGTLMTNSGSMAVFAITLSGHLCGGIVHILVDIVGDGNWVSVGSLTDRCPAKLIMLPAGAKCNARLDCLKGQSEVTVAISS